MTMAQNSAVHTVSIWRFGRPKAPQPWERLQLLPLGETCSSNAGIITACREHPLRGRTETGVSCFSQRTGPHADRPDGGAVMEFQYQAWTARNLPAHHATISSNTHERRICSARAARKTTSISAERSHWTSSLMLRSSSKRSWTARMSASTLRRQAGWCFSAADTKSRRGCMPSTNLFVSNSGRWAKPLPFSKELREDRFILFGEWAAVQTLSTRIVACSISFSSLTSTTSRIPSSLIWSLVWLLLEKIGIPHRPGSRPRRVQHRRTSAPPIASGFEQELIIRHFIERTTDERLYLRTAANGRHHQRAKLVRSEFVEKVKQSEHWQHQAIAKPNLFIAEGCGDLAAKN